MADDETYEAKARDWLESVDTPPPRLEVTQIVLIGQRQVRRRRLLAVGGTAAMLAAVAAIPAAVPLWPGGGGGPPAAGAVLDCTITELPLPDGLPVLEPSQFWLTYVVAMDRTGRHVVGTAMNGPIETVLRSEGDTAFIDGDGGDQLATILWRDGIATYLSGLTEARDVNSSGTVVGDTWVYRDGAVDRLAVPDGYDTVHANAINEAGDVVGRAMVDDNDGGELGSAAVVWPGSDLDHPRLLTLAGAEPDPIFAEAVDILDDGTILGHITYEQGAEGRPYRWDAGGELHELLLPPKAIGASIGPARGDWVFGSVLMEVPPSEDEPVPSPSSSGATSSADAAAATDDIPDYGFRPARWNLRAGTVELIELVDSNGLIAGADISLAGDVVLASGPSGSGETEEPGVVIREATPVALPVPDGAVGKPAAISDDGTVIAGSQAVEVPVDPTEQEGPYYHIPQLSSSVPVVWQC